MIPVVSWYYRVAEEGLRIDDPAPPMWLTEALSQLRGERVSRP
jgi:hypothetical protein